MYDVTWGELDGLEGFYIVLYIAMGWRGGGVTLKYIILNYKQF